MQEDKKRPRGRALAGLCSDALHAGTLWVRAGGLDEPWVALGETERRELRRRLAAGELDELAFRAITFRAVYPNANYLRFRDEELGAFAGSFSGQPFLRDHDHRHVAARAGTVTESILVGDDFLQVVKLTVPRDIEAFLNGQFDRFSIAWYWDSITCSVCGGDWLRAECRHWPGRKYGAGEEEVLCELIFEHPTGKEVSAVNVPAVRGTGIREILDELMSLKEAGADGCDPAGARFDAKGGSMDGEQERRTTDDGRLATERPSAPSGSSAGSLTGAGGEGEVVAEMLEAQRSAVLDARLAASGLPHALQELVRSSLPSGWRIAQLDDAINKAQDSWASLEEARTVKNMAPRPLARSGSAMGGMLDSRDRVQLALEGLLAARRPEKGVRPLSGIREFYILMSGDYEMRGIFNPENVGLAAVDSATMAGMVADALNKVVVNSFQQYPRWWEPIVTPEDFATLQQTRWITLGGVGELPTVAEGAAYAELTWDDQTETADWVKKGGYLGISLEAIDKDDTRRLQQAGPALARAAWLTLGKAVSNIFTANAGIGPVMSDGLPLFSPLHNNLGNAALTYAAWETTRAAMRKQTELNSGERLGGLVVPRYMLAPPDLEGVALQVMASEAEPAQANWDANVFAEGNTLDARLAAARRRVIVVDFWTDVDDWAAVADPLLYPSIGLGYRFGREPEIFSVASPTSGLLFASDTLPIKVRFFFAVGPTDWRGLYKHNV